jgi:transcriptional regulator with XRE-family HTH domain
MKGAELRTIRKRLDKTQSQLAEAVGVATNTIARYERDEMRISEPVARLVRTIAESKRKK